jgi:hypothetical protein
VDEDDVAKILDVLVQIREDWAAEHAIDVAEDFRVVHRGGVYTETHSGMTWDIVRGEARSELSKEFCRLFHLRQTGNFSRTTYGDSWAAKLALRWTWQVDYFFRTWIDHGCDPAFAFDAGLGPEEGPAFRAGVDALPAGLS